jgi:hypothetical protein
MSHWSDNPEYFDEKFAEMAMRGDFGPEMKRQVDEGELCNCEIYYKLDAPTQYEAARNAEEAFWDDKYAAANARRKANRENAL